MTNTITVRGLNPQDKSWLQQAARTRGVSMEALVRQFIHERRGKSQRHATPAEAFKRHIGPEHGVELPPWARYGYRPRGDAGTPPHGGPLTAGRLTGA